jgi:hypothetical protein
MPSLRAEIAELRRRMVALEARQLVWRHDAAAAVGSPGAPDYCQGAAFELTDGMRGALDTLWQRSVECGQPFAQVDITLCEDDTTIAVRGYLRNGRDFSVYFDQPPDFDAFACRRAFEVHLNV